MTRRPAVLAAIFACALLVVVPASPAKLSTAQRFFRGKLLRDDSTSRDVKTRLRKGGFVDRKIMFADLTGEGRSDAVVLVHSGGSAGRIALYVFSSGHGTKLKVVYRNQRLYRASARVPHAGSPRVGTFFYRVPKFDPGDELCCPAAYLETELRWSASRKRFVVESRRRIERKPVARTPSD
jgi:hypothetical protein